MIVKNNVIFMSSSSLESNPHNFSNLIVFSIKPYCTHNLENVV